MMVIKNSGHQPGARHPLEKWGSLLGSHHFIEQDYPEALRELIASDIEIVGCHGTYHIAMDPGAAGGY